MISTDKGMKTEDFSRYNATGSDLRTVQLSCFEILKKFRDVCEQNHLQYFLAYGTLLGAVRHKGYIPWDDDIDVWMPRSDMEKFLEIANEQMRPYVINFYTIDNEASMKYRSQPCIEDHKCKVGFNLGGKIVPGYIWIDIMPLDGMPENKYSRRLQCKLFSLWYMLIGFARSSEVGAFNPSSKKGLKKIGMELNDKLKIGKLLDVVKCLDGFENQRKKYDYDKSKYVIGTTTSYIEKAIFLKSWFGKRREMEFEGEKFRVPFGTEKILTKLYGDYMQYPPEEARHGSHFQVLSMK